MTAWHLREIVRCIRFGGVIAYPTEAVYGLGCDPLNHNAVLRILELKQRDISKGLILIAATQHQLAPFIETPSPAIQAKLDATWPGPVTWLVPARRDTPKWLTGKHETIAVRVSAHPVVQAICRTLEHPLVSTSANISNHPTSRTALTVHRHFHDLLDFIVHADVGSEKNPSLIRNAISGEIVRPN